MIPARVSLVTLGTRDLKLMRDFYSRMGWENTNPGDEGYAQFKTGGVTLALFPLDQLLADANLPASTPVVEAQFRGVTLAVKVESQERVDTSIEAARAVGARVLREPSEAFWGGRTAYFSDPEGNIWEVAWASGTSFDERGGLIWPT